MKPKWRHCPTREKETLNLASSESRVPRKGLTFKLFRNFWTIVFVDFPSFPCRSALRNWLFQVSKDGKNWTTLYTHTDDNSLNEPGYDILWLFPSRTFIYFCRLVVMFPIHQDSLQGFEILRLRRIFRGWGWGLEGVVKPPKLKTRLLCFWLPKIPFSMTWNF